MKKDPRIFLTHILDSILDIQEYVRNFSQEKFSLDRKTQDAVLRKLGIIGEAVKNISSDFKKKHPKIPWQEITGMRNILIHEYFGIHLKLIWKTVRQDIPKLKKNILVLLRKLDDKNPQLRMK